MSKYLSAIFRDKEGNVVIGQRPNWQIIVTLISYVGHRVINGNVISDLFYLFFIIFFAWWALLELFSGVNYFRRTLGLMSLVLIVFLIISKI